MKKGFILSILSIILLTSCTDNIHLVIDNPTKFSVGVTLDTLKIIVPPKEVVRIDVIKGEHQLKLENDSIIKYNFTESVYMINPSLSEYLVCDSYYGPELFLENFTSEITKKEVTFLGMSLEGNYDVIKDVINTVTWDYGPREALPETVDVDENKTYTSFVKVYDSDEFMDLLKSKIVP